MARDTEDSLVLLCVLCRLGFRSDHAIGISHTHHTHCLSPVASSHVPAGPYRFGQL
jgi:hypothetical protein